MKINAKITINTKKCGPDAMQAAQKYIDNAVLRGCDPYIPFDTGMLRDSGVSHTKIGSGLVVWRTPYAKARYYKCASKGLRGAKWFVRAKADKKSAWLSGVGKILGGGI